MSRFEHAVYSWIDTTAMTVAIKQSSPAAPRSGMENAEDSRIDFAKLPGATHLSDKPIASYAAKGGGDNSPSSDESRRSFQRLTGSKTMIAGLAVGHAPLSECEGKPVDRPTRQVNRLPTLFPLLVKRSLAIRHSPALVRERVPNRLLKSSV